MQLDCPISTATCSVQAVCNQAADASRVCGLSVCTIIKKSLQAIAFQCFPHFSHCCVVRDGQRLDGCSVKPDMKSRLKLGNSGRTIRVDREGQQEQTQPSSCLAKLTVLIFAAKGSSHLPCLNGYGLAAACCKGRTGQAMTESGLLDAGGSVPSAARHASQRTRKSSLEKERVILHA